MTYSTHIHQDNSGKLQLIFIMSTICITTIIFVQVFNMIFSFGVNIAHLIIVMCGFVYFCIKFVDITLFEKALVEKAAAEKAAVEKAAVEKDAVEKAAVEKAAVEKAAMEKDAPEWLFVEKADTESLFVRKSDEPDEPDETDETGWLSVGNCYTEEADTKKAAEKAVVEKAVMEKVAYFYNWFHIFHDIIKIWFSQNNLIISGFDWLCSGSLITVYKRELVCIIMIFGSYMIGLVIYLVLSWQNYYILLNQLLIIVVFCWMILIYYNVHESNNTKKNQGELIQTIHILSEAFCHRYFTSAIKLLMYISAFKSTFKSTFKSAFTSFCYYLKNKY